MRIAILLTLGVALLAVPPTPADDKKPGEVPKPSKDSYVKIRVEVEIRGILRDDGKAVTVTAQDRVYNLFHPNEEHSEWTRAAVYTLDFVRVGDLRELAKILNDKEVIVTAMAEVRRHVQKIDRPAGGHGFGGSYPLIHPTPSWFLEPTVQVIGLKSAAGK